MTIPPGDVLVIAGDITNYGFPDEIKAFNENMGEFFCILKVNSHFYNLKLSQIIKNISK